MKITSYMAIFQTTYILHWNNLRILFLLGTDKREASLSSNNDIYFIGIIVTIILKYSTIKILY